MRDHYDFSASKPNPYVKRRKRQITIRLDEDTIAHFKAMATRKGLPVRTGNSRSYPKRSNPEN